jgi:Flp pilus assembly protein TadG
MKLAGRSRQRGQGLIEFAVIFPIFAIILFAVIDGGLLMGRYNNINNAAKEGARLAAVGAAPSDIVTRVQQQAHGELDPNGSHALSTNCGDYASPPSNTNVICVQWITGANGELPGNVGSSVRVLVKYHYPFLTPIVNWIISGGWTIEACGVQRLERPVTVISNPAPTGVSDCSGATGGTPTTPTPVTPTATPTRTPTNTPVPTNTATRTPVPPTATKTPVPSPTPCPNGNSQAAQNCHATRTAIALTPTATP